MKKLLSLVALLLTIQIATAQTSFTDNILGYTITLPSDWDLTILSSVDTALYHNWYEPYSSAKAKNENINTEDLSPPPPPPPPPPPHEIDSTDPPPIMEMLSDLDADTAWKNNPTYKATITIFSDVIILKKLAYGSIMINSAAGNPYYDHEEEFCKDAIKKMVEGIKKSGATMNISKKSTEKIKGKIFSKYDYSLSINDKEMAKGSFFYWTKEETVFIAAITYHDKKTKKLLFKAFEEVASFKQ